MAQVVNPNAEIIGKSQALMMNAGAAKSMANLLKTNLGPNGTMKMLVSGAGLIKVTKDGKALLDEVPFLHPTASLIARQATAQDDITGDGTTSSVLLTGELVTEAERINAKGLHARIIVDGFDKARDEVIKFLDEFKVNVDGEFTEAQLLNIARTSIRTKVPEDLADHLASIVVKAVLTIRDPESINELDLHMIEIMHMRHGAATDTRFVDGLVLDHGARHPNMAKRSEKAHIFVCNISLEYEKSMVNSTMMYKSAAERQKLVAAERKITDDKVQKIIAVKDQVCGKDGSVNVINQNGIDPISLDLLQKAGIVGIRRAKRRNMERLSKACGGYAVNALEDLNEDCLGYAELVYEHALGDDVYTFVEGCKNSHSCTILVNGPNDHTIAQIKGALRDGLRAVANAITDKCYVPGAGAFEISAHNHLMNVIQTSTTYKPQVKIGMRVYAEALLTIPKTLAQNSNFDAQTTIMALTDEARRGARVGLDIKTGKALLPESVGIIDNYCVKKQFIHLGTMMANNLILVDEVMRAGKKMSGKD